MLSRDGSKEMGNLRPYFGVYKSDLIFKQSINQTNINNNFQGPVSAFSLQPHRMQGCTEIHPYSTNLHHVKYGIISWKSKIDSYI